MCIRDRAFAHGIEFYAALFGTRNAEDADRMFVQDETVDVYKRQLQCSEAVGVVDKTQFVRVDIEHSRLVLETQYLSLIHIFRIT